MATNKRCFKEIVIVARLTFSFMPTARNSVDFKAQYKTDTRTDSQPQREDKATPPPRPAIIHAGQYAGVWPAAVSCCLAFVIIASFAL